MKKQGFWTEFYNDGEVRRILYYENDSIIRPKCPDISACIFFEDNSLKIGKKTRVRVRYLHPHDIFTASENIKIEKLEDASEYDYCITPLSGKAADFYYLKKEKEEIPDKEIGIMAKKLHVSRKEIEQLHMERIITKQVFLKSMKIM